MQVFISARSKKHEPELYSLPAYIQLYLFTQFITAKWVA